MLHNNDIAYHELPSSRLRGCDDVHPYIGAHGRFGVWLKVVPSCPQDGTSCLLLQTLLLQDVSFSHHTHRKTAPQQFPRLEKSSMGSEVT